MQIYRSASFRRWQLWGQLLQLFSIVSHCDQVIYSKAGHLSDILPPPPTCRWQQVCRVVRCLHPLSSAQQGSWTLERRGFGGPLVPLAATSRRSAMLWAGRARAQTRVSLELLHAGPMSCNPAGPLPAAHPLPPPPAHPPSRPTKRPVAATGAPQPAQLGRQASKQPANGFELLNCTSGQQTQIPGGARRGSWAGKAWKLCGASMKPWLPGSKQQRRRQQGGRSSSRQQRPRRM
jgi:hypothetical protein